jgi:hypothetical protein
MFQHVLSHHCCYLSDKKKITVVTSLSDLIYFSVWILSTQNSVCFTLYLVVAVPSPSPTLGPGINLNQAATASLPHLLTNGSSAAVQQHQQLLSAMQQPQLVTPQSSLVTAAAQPNSAPSHQPPQRSSHHQQHNHHYSVANLPHFCQL